jgi:hypothetical protein
MGQENEIDPLVEWAVFFHLNPHKELELILLKGHLLLETVLETVLKRHNISNIENFSFYRKIREFETLEIENKMKKEFIVSSLKEINKLRNKVAHEFHFNIGNGEFEVWASDILSNLKGKKFTKYTFKTKIVHSFSVMAMNILELERESLNPQREAGLP